MKATDREPVADVLLGRDWLYSNPLAPREEHFTQMLSMHLSFTRLTLEAEMWNISHGSCWFIASDVPIQELPWRSP